MCILAHTTHILYKLTIGSEPENIDTSEAEKVPGVVKVVTGKEFPYHFGLYMQDRYILPRDQVRFVGEQVAAVIARDLKTAKRAAELVKVEYEPLPAVFDPVEAIKEDAPLIHPDLGNYPHVPWFFPRGGTNIAHWRKIWMPKLKSLEELRNLVTAQEHRAA